MPLVLEAGAIQARFRFVGYPTLLCESVDLHTGLIRGTGMNDQGQRRCLGFDRPMFKVSIDWLFMISFYSPLCCSSHGRVWCDGRRCIDTPHVGFRGGVFRGRRMSCLRPCADLDRGYLAILFDRSA